MQHVSCSCGNDGRASRPDELVVRGLRSAHAGPFSFSVAPGECLMVRGPSGAGKSLLLRMLADLDDNSGEVMLGDCERSTLSAPQWRRKVVYQSAEPAWWETTAGAHFTPPQLVLAQALLPQVGMGQPHLERDITLLSTGERQRMALVRSLANAPEVLLLDEPTAALDALSTQLVEQLLRRQLDLGLALLFVTHSEEQAARMGDRELRVVPSSRQTGNMP